jgi:Fur family ferric uptake transcriptional regulator
LNENEILPIRHSIDQKAIDVIDPSVDHSAMETPEQVFRNFLRQRSLKYTTERLAILNAVQKFGRPFEAEELLLTLREGDYRTSKATIYRTLKHLLDAGLLKQVHFGGGKQAHYDFVNPADAHDHLLDLDTGKIIPFSSDLVVKLREHIAKKMGFTSVSHRFQIIARKNPESPGTPQK